jgi:hypothetical protein
MYLKADHDGALQLGAILSYFGLGSKICDSVAPSKMHPDWYWYKFADFAL